MANPKPEQELPAVTEETLLRQHIKAYLDAMSPVLVLVISLSLLTYMPTAEMQHLRSPTFFGMVVGALGLGSLRLALRASDMHLASVVKAVEVGLLGARLLVHSVFIFYRVDALLARLITVLWLPLSAARSCHSREALVVYLVLHFALVLFRFSDDWSEGLPWFLTTAFVCKMQLEWVQQQSEQRKLRLQLASTLAELERVAKATTKDIFDRLCDASATLAADGCMALPAPQLAAMLGRAGQLQGRPFRELVHTDDVPGFDAVLEESGESGEKQGKEVRHLQLRLCDAFGQPVPVHLFHARFQGLDHKPMLLFGVSESWQPPKRQPPHHEHSGGPLNRRSAAALRPMRGAPRSSSSEKRSLLEAQAGLCNKTALSPRVIHGGMLSKEASICLKSGFALQPAVTCRIPNAEA